MHTGSSIGAQSEPRWRPQGEGAKAGERIISLPTTTQDCRGSREARGA